MRDRSSWLQVLLAIFIITALILGPGGAQAQTWAQAGMVFGPASGMPYGALAGEYVGASGDVGIGLGAGASPCGWLKSEYRSAAGVA
jgi:hypothetical protein